MTPPVSSPRSALQGAANATGRARFVTGGVEGFHVVGVEKNRKETPEGGRPTPGAEIADYTWGRANTPVLKCDAPGCRTATQVRRLTSLSLPRARSSPPVRFRGELRIGDGVWAGGAVHDGACLPPPASPGPLSMRSFPTVLVAAAAQSGALHTKTSNRCMLGWMGSPAACGKRRRRRQSQP